MLSMGLLLLASCMLWSAFYALLCCINRKKSYEWNCRIVATCHAILLTICVDIICFITGPWPLSHIAEENTRLQSAALYISAGYFLFDTIWCIFMQTESVLMTFHHVVSLVSLVGGLWYGRSASEITAVIWGSELTNPFLQIRWFLKQTNQYSSAFAKINDSLFFSLFAVVRIGIGGYLCYVVLISPNTIWWIKIGGVIFYSISVIWMWQIVKFAIRRFDLRR